MRHLKIWSTLALAGWVGLGCVNCTGEVELGTFQPPEQEEPIDPSEPIQPSSCDLSSDPLGESSRVEFATFWAEGNVEGPALGVVEARLQELGLTSDPLPLPSRTTQHKTLKQWLTSDRDSLPDVFLANGGSDLLQFVWENPGASDQLCPLDRVAEERDLVGQYFRAALEPLYCGDTLYAFPMGLHRINLLYVNQAVYEVVSTAALQAGTPLPPVDEIDTLDAFVEVLEITKELGLEGSSGAELVPLSLDGTSRWPVQLLAFEGILAALSRDSYAATWKGRPRGESDTALRKVYAEMADFLAEMGPHTDLAEEIAWPDALERVATGKALFTMMGDWGWAKIVSDGWEEDVTLLPFPGSGETFVYTVDSFAVPQQLEEDGAAAYTWLTQVMDHHDTQLEFALKKNSIPPRKTYSREELEERLPEYLVDTYDRFERCDDDLDGCDMLLAVSGLGPAANADACFDEIGLRLYHVAGHDLWETQSEESACSLPRPQSPDEAREQVIEQLIELSRVAYAEPCRNDAP